MLDDTTVAYAPTEEAAKLPEATVREGSTATVLSKFGRLISASYEAVRKQIKRYEADLEGHIIRQGNTQFLDDEAVKFLDGKRASNPVIIYEHDKDIQIEQLQEENANLKTALAEAEHKRAETLEALAKEKDLRIEQQSQMLALEQKSDADKKLSDAEKQPGYTIVPTLVFIDDNGRAKVDIALCRGKKSYDKRQTLKEKEDRREMDRAIKHY